MKRRCPGSGREPSAVREGDVDGAICPACGIGQRMGPPGLVAPHSTVVAPVPKRRKALPWFGRKAEREAAAWAVCREAVIARTRGLCEAWDVWDPEAGRSVCEVGRHAGAHVHHVWPEDRDAGCHEPERCLLLCPAAHRWAHDWPARAAVVGLLRPTQIT